MAVSAIHDITDTDRDGTPDNMTVHVWVTPGVTPFEYILNKY